MKVMSGNPTGIKTLGKSQIPHTQFILVKVVHGQSVPVKSYNCDT